MILRMKNELSRLNYEHLRPALIAGVVLFALTYAADATLEYAGIVAAKTIFNDMVIAIAGATILLLLLSQHHKNQIVARAKERAIVVAELSHHIRNAMTPLALVMASPDTGERLRMLDMATDRVDYVLTDLLPTVGSASKPRFF
jgi:hypothetical protein